MGTAVRQICIPAKQLCDSLNPNTGSSAGAGEEKRTFCTNFGSLPPQLMAQHTYIARGQANETSPWGRNSVLLIYEWERLIFDYTQQDSFLLHPSPSLLLWVKSLACSQSPPSPLVFFRAADSLHVQHIGPDFFFFLINYPAPSTLFIQCKATVKCHLIIKRNGTHSFWGKGNTQLR